MYVYVWLFDICSCSCVCIDMWRHEVDIWNVSQSLTVWLIKEGSLHESRAHWLSLPWRFHLTSPVELQVAATPLDMPQQSQHLSSYSGTANFAHWIQSPSKISVFETSYCFSCHTALPTTSKEERVKTKPSGVPDPWGSISSLTNIPDIKQTWVSAFASMKKLSPTQVFWDFCFLITRCGTL